MNICKELDPHIWNNSERKARDTMYHLKSNSHLCRISYFLELSLQHNQNISSGRNVTTKVYVKLFQFYLWFTNMFLAVIRLNFKHFNQLTNFVLCLILLEFERTYTNTTIWYKITYITKMY